MKLTKFSEKGLQFDNGTVVEDLHQQDCCEMVYADWKQLEDTDVMSHDFPEKLIVKGIKDSGIKIDGYFIPCYNDQNGYYGSDLSIIITYANGRKRTIDISKFVEDK